MSILKTTQTIKVKVSANGGITPIPTSSPVVLKNTVREEIFLSQLADVTPNTSANGATLVYNTSTGKYEAKVVSQSLDDISNFDSTPTGNAPANGSIVVFNTDTGNYEVRPIELALGDLVDINEGTPSDGFLLVYNAQTGKYDIRGVNYNLTELNDVSGSPSQGATLVFDQSLGKFVIKALDFIPSINGGSTTLVIKTTSDVEPNDLANGELAFSTSSNNLYVGTSGGSRLIAGEEFIFVSRARPGLLTSNAAIVVDGDSFIDLINTQQLRVGPDSNAFIIDNVSGFANATQLGNTTYGSNNELVTSYAIKTYVDTALSTVSIPTTPYALPIATGNTLGGVKVGDGLSIDSVTGVLSATGGGTSYNLPLASEGTLGGIKIGAGLSIDGDGVVSVQGGSGEIGVTVEGAQDAAANLLINGTHTGISFVYDDVNQAINATVTGGGGGGATNINALTDVEISSAANNQLLTFNQASGQWRNTTLSGNADQTSVTFSGSGINVGLSNNVIITGNVSIGQQLSVTNVASFSNNVNIVGNVAAHANVSIDKALSVNGTATFTNTVLVNSSLDVMNYANFANTVDIAKTLSVSKQASFGNTVLIQGAVTTQNSVSVAANLTVGNLTTTHTLLANNLTVDNGVANIVAETTITGNTTISGSVQLGTSSSQKVFVGGELASNVIPDANNIYSLGSPERRFKDVYVSGGTIFVDQIELSSPPGGGLLVAGQLTVAGNASVVGNTTLTGKAVITDSTTLLANVSVGSSHTDLLTINAGLSSDIIPTSNTTSNLGNAELYFANAYVQTLNARDGIFAGNVQISGDFTVLGNLTSLSVQTVDVEDPLIKLAGNNNSDAVDVGFYGRFNSSGNVQYTGLVRDATDGKYKLFGVDQEPTATVDTEDETYHYKTLVSYVESGGLVSNATNVRISSNSSVSVDVIANTLSLGTPLDVGSGGTGKQSFTNNSILLGKGTAAIAELTGLEGQVLQIINGVPTFGPIDCGYY